MNLKSRVQKLEQQSVTADKEPPYITIQEGDEIPEGYTGKVYVGISPDDWDVDFENETGSL